MIWYEDIGAVFIDAHYDPTDLMQADNFKKGITFFQGVSLHQVNWKETSSQNRMQKPQKAVRLFSKQSESNVG